MKKYTLNKAQRIKSKTETDELFTTAQRVKGKYFRLLFHLKKRETQEPIKLLVSVPKRNFKLAVTRNLLKRRIREIFRTHQREILAIPEDKVLQLGIIYSSTEIRDFNDLKEGLILSLRKLNERIH